MSLEHDGSTTFRVVPKLQVARLADGYWHPIDEEHVLTEHCPEREWALLLKRADEFDCTNDASTSPPDGGVRS